MWWWGRARTSGRASRTPRSTRSTKRVTPRAGATLYCTLEPCAHTGRTGPCTERIIAAGIRRVVAAMEDPFPLVSGTGLRGAARARHRGRGWRRARGGRAPESAVPDLRADGRPFVILKAATSLDGRIAPQPGARTALTSAAALRRAQYERAWVDAIGVGSETMLVDDPLLTVREVYRERPLTRVVFDRRLRTPPTARVFSTLADGPVIVLTTAAALPSGSPQATALADAGATVIAASAAGYRGGPS